MAPSSRRRCSDRGETLTLERRNRREALLTFANVARGGGGGGWECHSPAHHPVSAPALPAAAARHRADCRRRLHRLRGRQRQEDLRAPQARLPTLGAATATPPVPAAAAATVSAGGGALRPAPRPNRLTPAPTDRVDRAASPARAAVLGGQHLAGRRGVGGVDHGPPGALAGGGAGFFAAAVEVPMVELSAADPVEVEAATSLPALVTYALASNGGANATAGGKGRPVFASMPVAPSAPTGRTATTGKSPPSTLVLVTAPSPSTRVNCDMPDGGARGRNLTTSALPTGCLMGGTAGTAIRHGTSPPGAAATPPALARLRSRPPHSRRTRKTATAPLSAPTRTPTTTTGPSPPRTLDNSRSPSSAPAAPAVLDRDDHRLLDTGGAGQRRDRWQRKLQRPVTVPRRAWRPGSHNLVAAGIDPSGDSPPVRLPFTITAASTSTAALGLNAGERRSDRHRLPALPPLLGTAAIIVSRRRTIKGAADRH